MKKLLYMTAVLTVSTTFQLLAQQDFSKVEIKSIEVTKGIYMLTGSGGNMGLCVGEDATFLIDDQYAPLTEKIEGAVREHTNEPIGFVLNTHWHGDHTGGNENLGKAGTVIFSQNPDEHGAVHEGLQPENSAVSQSSAARCHFQ